MEYIPPILKSRQTPGGEQSFCFRRQVCDAANKVYIPLILQKKEWAQYLYAENEL